MASVSQRIKDAEARAALLAPKVADAETSAAQWWAYVRRNRTLIADFFDIIASREADNIRRLEGIASKGTPPGLVWLRDYLRSDMKAVAVWRGLAALMDAEDAGDETAQASAAEQVETAWDMLPDDNRHVATTFDWALYPARSSSRYNQWIALNQP